LRITVAESPQTDGWRRLLRQAKRPVWVKSAVLTHAGRSLPVSPAKRTFSETVSMSQKPAQEQTLDSSSATVSFHFDHHRKRARGLSAIFLRRVPNSSLVSPARDDKKVGQCSMLILKGHFQCSMLILTGHLKTFIFSAKCPYRSRAEVRIAAQTRRCQSRP